MIFSHVLYQLSYLGMLASAKDRKAAFYRGWGRDCPAHPGARFLLDCGEAGARFLAIRLVAKGPQIGPALACEPLGFCAAPRGDLLVVA